MMKTSPPRMFSSNLTKVSPLGKGVTWAEPSETPTYEAIFSARGRLAEPENIWRCLPKSDTP